MSRRLRSQKFRANVRFLVAPTDWAFSPGENALIGVALTAAALPLWMHLSLLDECRSRVDQALATLSTGAFDDPRREMRLLTALSASMILARSPAPELGEILARALEIAEALDDTEYRLRSLRSLWFFHTYGSRHRLALELAQRFVSLAEGRRDPNDSLAGERLVGASHHLLGDYPNARSRFEYCSLITSRLTIAPTSFAFNLIYWLGRAATLRKSYG